jgi:hypothetical protein
METRAIVSNTAEAWRKYVSVGAITSHLLRKHVLRAWVRSHDQGASPWVARAEVLSRAETERVSADHDRLIAAARPYLNLLSQSAGNERHAAMLGTAQSIILDVIGDEQSVSGPERVPGSGSLLSEATCGSNGIGTPLAEGRYVELISTEHFIHGFHPFTCHGIPIQALGGGYEGVLSISVRQPETAERLHEVLVCAAYGIAAELTGLRLADEVRRVMVAGPHASLEPLHAELVRLGVRPPGAGPGGAGSAEGMFHETMELLRLAGDAKHELEQRERAWRELASGDLGIPSEVDLADEIAKLIKLMEPEIRRRRVEVTFERELEPQTGLVDRRKLRRDLFRLLLHGIEAAEEGGAITMDMGEDSSRGLCYARLVAVPGPERPGEKLVSSVLCPSMSHLRR